MPGHDKRLLISIHDVGPAFSDEVDRLAERLHERIGGHGRYALLVVPDHWGNAPITGDPGFQRKLRGWAAAGAEIFVHGWYHRDAARHAGLLASLKARHMTAGEGEFLGLSSVEAACRMRDGRDLIEGITGLPVAGFIAPAWLYGPGAVEALREVGFPLAEDHMKVWRPSDGRVLARGPVITWASRSRARIASSLAFAKIARHALQSLPTVRIAVHPGDAHEPRLLKSIDRTLTAFVPDRRVGCYAELLLHPNEMRLGAEWTRS